MLRGGVCWVPGSAGRAVEPHSCPLVEPLQPRSGFSHPPANSNCVDFQLLFFLLSSEHVFPISE